MRLADYFDKAVARGTRAHALIEGDVRVTHRQVQALAHAAANAMDADDAIRAGVHVAIYSPNHWRVPVVLLAINGADRVRLPVHTRNPLAVNLLERAPRPLPSLKRLLVSPEKVKQATR